MDTEERMVKILKENPNVLTSSTICWFYCKEIFPKQIKEEKIIKILETLIKKRIVEKNQCGNTYYNLIKK